MTEADAQSNVIYFMMVDRFANGDSKNDKPLHDPRVDPKADFHGGDIVGITQKIKEGYFDSLGVNMLWISPIVPATGSKACFPTRSNRASSAMR